MLSMPQPTLTAITARGEWPADVAVLPIFLTQQQYAHLRGVTVRALQRERRLGKSIPFKKQGKQVLYAREDVLAPATALSSPVKQQI